MRSRREVWFPPNTSLALALVFFNKDFNFNLVNKGCNKLLSYIVPPSKMVIKVSCPVFLQEVSVVLESTDIVSIIAPYHWQHSSQLEMAPWLHNIFKYVAVVVLKHLLVGPIESTLMCSNSLVCS